MKSEIPNIILIDLFTELDNQGKNLADESPITLERLLFTEIFSEPVEKREGSW